MSSSVMVARTRMWRTMVAIIRGGNLCGGGCALHEAAGVLSGRDRTEGHTNFRGRVLDCEENGAETAKAILK
jgi:hypothetical protein